MVILYIEKNSQMFRGAAVFRCSAGQELFYESWKNLEYAGNTQNADISA